MPKKKKIEFKDEQNKTDRNNIDKEKVKSYSKQSEEKNTINVKKIKKLNYNKFVNHKRKKSINNLNINTFNNINNSSNKSNNDLKKITFDKKDSKICSPGPILTAMSNIVIKKNNDNRNSSSQSYKSNPKKVDTHNYSPDNSFDLLPELSPEYEEIENKVNFALDEEIKQLELDEENIKRLIEQLNDDISKDLFPPKNSGDSKISNISN